MSVFKEAVRCLVKIETAMNAIQDEDPRIFDAWEKVETAGKKDPEGVWDVLRNGSEDEFSALCNCLPEIGGEFEDDNNRLEIMRIARRRLENPQNHQNLMDGIKGGFGVRFQKFWDETEPDTNA